MSFKYNYFTRGDNWPCGNIIWRPGPDFSLLVPRQNKQSENVMINDSWMTSRIEKHQAPLWGSWMQEREIIVQPVKHAGENRRSNNFIPSYLTTPTFSAGILGSDKPFSSESEIPLPTGCLEFNESISFNERDQPVEEPWFLHSTLRFLDTKAILDLDGTKGESYRDDYQTTPREVTDEEINLSAIEESVSTVILINSSVCSMQRIAVLEDGKLVELLLEPVKNNVQCSSVYLGVVTKLVPHMGGAFVDIGLSRPSLMDIKLNREPFVYPPFSCKATSKNESNNVLIEHMKDVSDTKELEEPTSYSVEDDSVRRVLDIPLQDDPLKFLQEELEDFIIDNELDVSSNSRISTSVSSYGADEDDYEDYFLGNGHHLKGDGEYLSSELETLSVDPLDQRSESITGSDTLHAEANKWTHVRKGTKVIVQVVKEELGTKGPALSAYPSLRSRFWVLSTRCDRIGVSKKITGVERTRLRVIAKTLQPRGFGLTVRTVAAGHSLEELQKDLEGLLLTWKNIIEQAKFAALAADEGIEGAIPVILHRAMGQTLSVVQDCFNEKVKKMIVDSPRTYHEVTTYLQEIAPDLCDRVQLYDKATPIFDEYGIEEEINGILNKRVSLLNGGSLVIEQTEALVSIDVNGGHGMLGQGTSQEEAILQVNLTAAKQIARELRLRDIGGIIVVDFIDMIDDSHKRLVYEEMKNAVERDRSMVKVSELSRHGLMEITRKRVRPSVTFMISEPCTCCHATGRVEALETSFSKIEQEICRLLAVSKQKADPENAKSWPRFVLRVDRYMCNYLTSGKRTRLAVLSSSLKVWILLKVARGFARGAFEVKPYVEDKSNSDRQEVTLPRLRPMDHGSCIPNSKITLFPVKKRKTLGK